MNLIHVTSRIVRYLFDVVSNFNATNRWIIYISLDWYLFLQLDFVEQMHDLAFKNVHRFSFAYLESSMYGVKKCNFSGLFIIVGYWIFFVDFCSCQFSYACHTYCLRFLNNNAHNEKVNKVKYFRLWKFSN